MLITGIQSVFEPRGELVAPNCEILKHFQRFSKHLRAFRRISRDFRMPGANLCFRCCTRNRMTPHERCHQKVLHSDTRFRQVAGFPAMR